MRSLLSLIVLCVSSLVFAGPLQDHSLNKRAVEELAEHLGLDPRADLVAQTQENWLRGSLKERWEMKELSLEQREAVLYWAETQGLYSEWEPKSQGYDKALILGATTGCMQKRLDYLIQLWNRGVRFSEVVWLTGERPLNLVADRALEGCQTESDAAYFLWKSSEMPDEMRQLPAVFIAVPMKQEGEIFKRPNTQDTLLAWLERNPSACSALFVSDQPFCSYQFSIINATLPEVFTFDVVGPSVNPFSHPAAAAITLDAIARQLYQESLFILPDHT